MQLVYAIKYVENMDKAVAFHRDILGLAVRFASPFWSEFDTGGTTLARNSFLGSFLSEEEKARHIARVDAYAGV